MPSLLAKEGPLAGERFEIHDEVVLGREGADVVVDDPELSRRHAAVRPVDGMLEIEDLNSLNGTWVNGRRIDGRATLAAGDEVRVGKTVFEVPPEPRRAADTVASPRATVAASQATVRAEPELLVLEIVAGPRRGERLAVDEPVVLGRESADVTLDDQEVSRHHAVLRRSGSAFELEDLDSLNGTWVNGERVSGLVALRAGDLVKLGATEIEVRRERRGLRETAPRPVPPPDELRDRPGRLSPESLARAASRRPWVAIGSWIAAFVLAVVLIVLLLGDALTSDQRLTNNPESLRAADLVATRFAQDNVPADLVIVRSADTKVGAAAFRQHVQQVVQNLNASGNIQGTRTFYDGNDPSLVSQDRQATLIPIVLKPGVDSDEAVLVDLVDRVEASSTERFETLITGEAAFDADLGTLAQNDLKTGELFFGGPAALIILLLVFGTVVAAIVPLVMAIVAIVTTLALVALLGQAFEISLFVVNMVTGMGLALGIDYSLFILSRYREERRGSVEKLEAIGAAGSTASRAVLFSGMAFVLALLGMLLVPDLILRSLAAGAIVVGFVSVIAALTLLPAVLSLLGDRLESLRVPIVGRSTTQQGASEGRFWGRIVRSVMRHPVLSLTLSVAFLLALALPLLSYETGFAGASTFPDDAQSKRAFIALQEEFPGTTSEPAQVVITVGRATPGVTAGIDRLRPLVAQDAIFGSLTVQDATARDATLIEVPVAGDSQSSEAISAVKKLRNDYVPQAFPEPSFEVLVGGQSAETIDYTQTSGSWLPRVFAFVLAMSFILLMLAFRSIVVPLKAILLNLLSVCAAYGLLVLVFVEGVGADLLGFQQVDTIVAWVPLFLFSVLFGLSMDYHVFLLSRIRERFLQTGDNDRAVEEGVSSTARLITGAALIIIAVFSGFAMGDLVMFQQMGFGIGVALFLDATVVRSVLVPASMKLLGERNWYLPKGLQWLPDVAVEGKERPRG